MRVSTDAVRAGIAKARRGRTVENCILDEDGVAGWDGLGAKGEVLEADCLEGSMSVRSRA